MIPVEDIWDEAVKLAGTCGPEVVYRKINRAVEILANKSDWDPLTGFMDISCEDTLVSLPREIETPLTVSYGRYPALARDQLWRFHLNGPGDKDVSCHWRWWEDGPEAVTAREIEACDGTAVGASACNPDDVGKTIWVYGMDLGNQPVRTKVNGVWVDGYPIVLLLSDGFVPDPDAPIFTKITRVRKPVTVGPIQLSTVTNNALDVLLAVYSWDDTEPTFRRLRIDRPAKLVRIFYRRKNLKLRSLTDLIPLHSAEAVVMMLRALKYYDDNEFSDAMAAEATAARWLTEEQETRNPSIPAPIQVLDMPSCDYLD